MTGALTEHLRRRQATADMHDQIRGRFRDYHTPEFARAMAPVVNTLADLAREAQASTYPAAEVGRTLMWFGDALFDMAQGGHVAWALPVDTYHQAERYVLAANDPTLRSKHGDNLANILMRAMPSAATLRDAIARYQAALTVLGATPATAGYQQGLTRATMMLGQFEEFERELTQRRAEAQALLTRLPAHRLSASRAARVGELLAKLGSAEAAADLSSMLGLLQQVMATFAELMQVADEAPAATASRRGGELAGLAMELWRAAMTVALGVTLSPPLRDPLFAATRRLVELATEARRLDERACVEFARVRLWPVCSEVRRLLAVERATWIAPVWPTPLVVEPSISVHIAGTTHAAAIAATCEARGVGRTVERPAQVYAEGRFASLRSAAIAIVDLCGDARDRAAACYEAGIAMVLGTPLVIVAPPGATPFDVDLDPVPVIDGALDQPALAAAIDRALALPQRPPTPTDRAPLVAAARRTFTRAAFLVDELARAGGPVEAAATLATVVQHEAANGAPTRVVVVPAWPRRYPEPGHRRVFHVMPFTAPWSSAVKAQVAARCAAAGVTYRRHDDVDDPRILRSLWAELSLADAAVVDLTGLNPNVALELGVLDALGTPTAVVGQDGTVGTLFRSIRDVRVGEYALGDARLDEAVDRLLRGLTTTTPAGGTA